MQTDTDYILLYIDNCEPALNSVLNCVAWGMERKIEFNAKVRSLRDFAKRNIPGILQKAGDREQARLIEKEFDELPKVNFGYWSGVYAYYLQKLGERDMK